MKNSASLVQKRPDRSGSGAVGKAAIRSPAAARDLKRPQIPKAKFVQPIGLLQEVFHNSEVRSVRFEYFNPNAIEVFLAGEFNQWQPRATPLKKQNGGTWAANLLLKPGQYEYRVVVDARWQDDPMSSRFVANPFGGLNSVIEVKPFEDANAK